MSCVLRLQLAIVHDQHNDRVLLGRKKKGFGEVSPKGLRRSSATAAFATVTDSVCCAVQGYYNGFGGKVEPGETIAEAAHREVRFGSVYVEGAWQWFATIPDSLRPCCSVTAAA